MQAELQGLLPKLRKVLKMPRLEFTSIVNQGDWLVEVPADMGSIPRVCCPAGSDMGDGSCSAGRLSCMLLLGCTE